MTLRTGTSGFSYKEWKGSFYPEDLPASGMLAWYGERLPAVEINNTFYRMPKASVLEGWAAQVPEGFRFVLKASRRITHFKRLSGVEDEMEYLVRTAAVLGERLGALLFQLPPNAPADEERLGAFLALLPEGVPAAFEFRHPSWLEEEGVARRLDERGLARVLADVDDAPEPEALPRGGLGYLRLRRSDYDRDRLASWAARIADAGFDEAFVFFKHEDGGTGPRWAAELLELSRRRGERKSARRGAEPSRRRESA